MCMRSLYPIIISRTLKCTLCSDPSLVNRWTQIVNKVEMCTVGVCLCACTSLTDSHAHTILLPTSYRTLKKNICHFVEASFTSTGERGKKRKTSKMNISTISYHSISAWQFLSHAPQKERMEGARESLWKIILFLLSLHLVAKQFLPIILTAGGPLSCKGAPQRFTGREEKALSFSAPRGPDTLNGIKDDIYIPFAFHVWGVETETAFIRCERRDALTFWTSAGRCGREREGPWLKDGEGGRRGAKLLPKFFTAVFFCHLDTIFHLLLIQRYRGDVVN